MRKVLPIQVLDLIGQGDNEEAHHCADLALTTLAKALEDHESALRAQERAKASECPDCGETCGQQGEAAVL